MDRNYHPCFCERAMNGFELPNVDEQPLTILHQVGELCNRIVLLKTKYEIYLQIQQQFYSRIYE